MAGEDRVAVVALVAGASRREMREHLQLRGEIVRLVHASRSGLTDIQLLQGHDVGRCSGNHLRDPRWRKHAVRAHAAVNVVSHYTERARRLGRTWHNVAEKTGILRGTLSSASRAPCP